MKKEFMKPSCDVVRFKNDVIATSGCACDSAGIDWTTFGYTNETCTGANVSCGCTENHSPSISNCVDL